MGELFPLFAVIIGIRQGCTSSHCSFTTKVHDTLLNTFHGLNSGLPSNGYVTDFDQTDDIVLMAGGLRSAQNDPDGLVTGASRLSVYFVHSKF